MYKKSSKSRIPVSRHEVQDDGDAFVPDTRRGGHMLDQETEALAEEFVAAVTSAEDVGEDARDEFITEEVGGPFLEIDVKDGLGSWFGTPVDGASADEVPVDATVDVGDNTGDDEQPPDDGR